MVGTGLNGPGAAPGRANLFAGLSCLADFKNSRDLRAVAELPRNALGKVQKQLLVKSLGEGTA